jgi:hypothetical protein
MNRSTKLFLPLLIISLLFLNGCAGTAYLNTFVKPPAGVYERSDLKLLVTASYAPERMAAAQETRDKFEQELLVELRNKSRYKQVTLVEEKAIEEGDLLMLVTIDYVHSVSGGARLMGGALAGAASFKTKVELFQDNSDKRVAEMICGTTSKASQGVFGADTNHQIHLVAEKIAVEFAP